MNKKRQHICLVDGSTYIFRAYHALPPLTRKSDGFPVGAISGFCNMLDKLIREEKEKRGITHILVVFEFLHWIYTMKRHVMKWHIKDIRLRFHL